VILESDESALEFADEYSTNKMAAVKMAVAPVLFLWYVAVSMVSACVPPSCVYVTQKPEEVWGRHALTFSFNVNVYMHTTHKRPGTR